MPRAVCGASVTVELDERVAGLTLETASDGGPGIRVVGVGGAGEDAGLDGVDAVELLLRSGELRDEKVFGGGLRRMFLLEGCDEVLEVLRVLVREQGEGLAGEAMRRGVPGDGGFSVVRRGSGGELAICAFRENLCVVAIALLAYTRRVEIRGGGIVGGGLNLFSSMRMEIYLRLILRFARPRDSPAGFIRWRSPEQWRCHERDGRGRLL